ncbi:MAG: PD40 domain-containing protein [Candidatus Cloacimonetes bacterium]|nr:PD40 domain-containing protein [Candidatus Cloacimonadota bacterium]MBS3767008.1 PD40 domain-containing protein [Candidatus Cloacimonadota bacterium]
MNKKIFLLILMLLLTSQVFGFGKNKVNVHDHEWSTLKTTHFDIHYEKGDDVLAQTATIILEDGYYRLQKLFEYSFTERIPVVIYTSHNEFEETNTLANIIGEGVGGFTEFIKNRVVVPFDGSYKNFENVLVHELTHVFTYYTMQGGRLSDFAQGMFFSMPMWFSEGLAEFCSIHGSEYNDMFMLDLVLNDNIIPLERVNGYLAYREGESFLLFLESEFGTDSIIKFMYNFKVYKSINEAAEKTFGVDFKNLQDRWRIYLKRKYAKFIVNDNLPQTDFNQITEIEDNKYSFNYYPDFSPDGSDILYFSDELGTTDIYRRSTLDLYNPKELVSTGFTDKYENVHYMKNSLSYFPDGKRFAFVTKTSKGDEISICKAKNGREIDRIKLNFESIFEIDVAPDGNRIVLVGLKASQNDIYLYNLDSKKLTRLTDDLYDDRYPRFSSDGSKIAFSSQRFVNKVFTSRDEKYNFSNLYYNIFTYDLDSDSLYAITNRSYDHIYPVWSYKDNFLVFTSYRDSMANLYAYDFNNSGFAQLSNVLCGNFCSSISKENREMIFSGYYKNGWNLYLKSNPFDSLDYYEKSKPEPVATFEFYTTFAVSDYKVYYPLDKKTRLSSSDRREVIGPNIRRTSPDTVEQKPPKNPDKAPESEDYKVVFTPDFVFGGLGYNTAYGLSAQLFLAMSDLLGNHHLQIMSDITDEIEESNIIVNYYNLKKRLDYGAGVFNLATEYYYMDTFYDPATGNLYDGKKVEASTGVNLLLTYPFDKFNRVDMYNRFSRWRRKWYYWANTDWHHLDQYDEKAWVYNTSVFFTHDTSLWGYTGPIRGSRWSLGMEKSFGKNNNYLNMYGDLRKYIPLSLNYQFAGRLNFGMSTGSDKQEFVWGSYYNLRGYLDEEFEDHNVGIASLEFRYPFIENVKLGFPLPIWFSNVRGAIFMDVGKGWSDWDEFEKFDGNELKMGYGWGTRMNMGYFVLKFDWAYRADINIQEQSPSFYFSLNAEF